MKKILISFLTFVLIFSSSNSLFANENPKSSKDIENEMIYTLRGINLFGGNLVFEYTYLEGTYIEKKEIPLPFYKGIDSLDKEKVDYYQNNPDARIRDLVNHSIYYLVLTDDDYILPEIIDASLFNKTHKNVVIDESFLPTYSQLNNEFIKTIYEAKQMSDEELLKKIEESNLFVFETHPLKDKNIYRADYNIFDYSSEFLNNHFPVFKGDYNPNNNSTENNNKNPNLTEKTDNPEGLESSNGKEKNNFILYISIFIIFAVLIYLFIKKRKEV